MTARLRRPHGHTIVRDEAGKVLEERDTVMCCHCNRHQEVQPRQDPSDLGGYCGMCHDYVCGPCHAKGSCTPLEKKIEQMEGRARLHRSILGDQA